jgi:hypothetical protein
VVVQEIFHFFKKRKVKEGYMAIKHDLQKAYDRVSWKFLEVVLANFGFDPKFIAWIMACVSTISSVIRVKWWENVALQSF